MQLADVREYLGLARDLGLFFGVPMLVYVGWQLYQIQVKSLETQVQVKETHIKSLEAQIAQLKETQYDRAWTQLKSQKELYESERAKLQQELDDAKAAGTAESAALKQRLSEVELIIREQDDLEERLKKEAIGWPEVLEGVTAVLSLATSVGKLAARERQARNPPSLPARGSDERTEE